MNKKAAKKEILEIFKEFKSITNKHKKELLSGLSQGKLYEYYVLSKVLTDLKRRGFKYSLPQSTLKLKGAPGKINSTDPHIDVTAPNGPNLKLFLSIEFQTLGNLHFGHSTFDRSAFHELDIALVDATAKGYPQYDEIYLAVECKSGKFGKNFVREVLGVRRELSLYFPPQPSCLTRIGGTHAVSVQAEPASEYWFAFIDDTALKYQGSPAEFGIDFKHIEP